MHLHTRRRTTDIFAEVPCAGTQRDQADEKDKASTLFHEEDGTDPRHLFCYDVWSLTYRCTGLHYPFEPP